MSKYKDALIELESVDIKTNAIEDRWTIKKVFDFENTADELHSLINYTSDEATKAHIEYCSSKMEYAFGHDSYAFWSSLRNSIMNAYTLRNYEVAEKEMLENKFKEKYNIVESEEEGTD